MYTYIGGSSGKESTCLSTRCGLDPWVRKIPREGNGNLLQYSCLGNPMDSGASWATVPGVAKESGMTATKEQQKQGHSKFLHFTHCMFSFNLRKNFIEHVFDCHS